MDILYIGGTGQSSLPGDEESVAAGHRVAGFNRGMADEELPAGVETIEGDMKDKASYGQLRGRRFDVVAQFMAFLPEQIARDIELFAGNAGQYVFISSASVYEKPPRTYLITEDVPAINPYWPYSQAMIAGEELL